MSKITMRGGTILLTACLFTATMTAPVLAAPRKVARPAARANTANPLLTSYVNRLRERITQNWNFPDGKNHVSLTVPINADGSIGEVSLVSLPKKDDAEQAALAAFNAAQPFDPLPQGTNSARLSVIFESTSDPHGDSSSRVLTRVDPIVLPKTQAGAPAETQPAK